MIRRNLYKIDNKPAVIGAGLLALDVVISSTPSTPSQFLAGGSCGNVLTILSYLGWAAFPVARLSNNMASQLINEDLSKWNVQRELISYTADGSTPIIIHRILKDNKGAAKHRYEFRNPEDGTYLPGYKPCLAKNVPDVVRKAPVPVVYFFDRINRSSIDLAKYYKERKTLVVFEPSNMKDEKGFRQCVEIADIIKFSSDRISGYDDHYPVCLAQLEVQTLGSGGLHFRCKGESSWTFLEGYEIENVIDAAGAGDWCTAGMLWYLHREQKDLENLTKNIVAKSLRFSQALSALNCTFEGARGLMYNVTKTELMLYVEHIIDSQSSIIHNKPDTKYEIKQYDLKISSLFAAS
ncbi:carbohydrate kinase family protein [Mucilaginibacter pedocola]|uniref:Carbohydrate kinase PfkB domain-containing protein n=1 Tax=Mucilaginibacter pedocola TaxID=1792845 RepID=A0A1S9PLW0_9SPHI|nr:hypothetical protein [Mucilaginibacter pedocola]OOQ61919.1 hypothetical protein BC343_02330 [Mucilaginibacter pedocola]